MVMRNHDYHKKRINNTYDRRDRACPVSTTNDCIVILNPTPNQTRVFSFPVFVHYTRWRRRCRLPGW